MGNTLREKVIGENFDKLFVSHQNSSDFSAIKVLRYTVPCAKEIMGNFRLFDACIKEQSRKLQMICLSHVLYYIVYTVTILAPLHKYLLNCCYGVKKYTNVYNDFEPISCKITKGGVI